MVSIKGLVKLISHDEHAAKAGRLRMSFQLLFCLWHVNGAYTDARYTIAELASAVRLIICQTMDGLSRHPFHA